MLRINQSENFDQDIQVAITNRQTSELTIEKGRNQVRHKLKEYAQSSPKFCKSFELLLKAVKDNQFTTASKLFTSIKNTYPNELIESSLDDYIISIIMAQAFADYEYVLGTLATTDPKTEVIINSIMSSLLLCHHIADTLTTKLLDEDSEQFYPADFSLALSTNNTDQTPVTLINRMLNNHVTEILDYQSQLTKTGAPIFASAASGLLIRAIYQNLIKVSPNKEQNILQKFSAVFLKINEAAAKNIEITWAAENTSNELCYYASHSLIAMNSFLLPFIKNQKMFDECYLASRQAQDVILKLSSDEEQEFKMSLFTLWTEQMREMSNIKGFKFTKKYQEQILELIKKVDTKNLTCTLDIHNNLSIIYFNFGRYFLTVQNYNDFVDAEEAKNIAEHDNEYDYHKMDQLLVVYIQALYLLKEYKRAFNAAQSILQFNNSNSFISFAYTLLTAQLFPELLKDHLSSSVNNDYLLMIFNQINNGKCLTPAQILMRLFNKNSPANLILTAKECICINDSNSPFAKFIDHMQLEFPAQELEEENAIEPGAGVDLENVIDHEIAELATEEIIIIEAENIHLTDQTQIANEKKFPEVAGSPEIPLQRKTSNPPSSKVASTQQEDHEAGTTKQVLKNKKQNMQKSKNKKQNFTESHSKLSQVFFKKPVNDAVIASPIDPKLPKRSSLLKIQSSGNAGFFLHYACIEFNDDVLFYKNNRAYKSFWAKIESAFTDYRVVPKKSKNMTGIKIYVTAKVEGYVARVKVAGEDLGLYAKWDPTNPHILVFCGVFSHSDNVISKSKTLLKNPGKVLPEESVTPRIARSR